MKINHSTARLSWPGARNSSCYNQTGNNVIYVCMYTRRCRKKQADLIERGCWRVEMENGYQTDGHAISSLNYKYSQRIECVGSLWAHEFPTVFNCAYQKNPLHNVEQSLREYWMSFITSWRGLKWVLPFDILTPMLIQAWKHHLLYLWHTRTKAQVSESPHASIKSAIVCNSRGFVFSLSPGGRVEGVMSWFYTTVWWINWFLRFADSAFVCTGPICRQCGVLYCFIQLFVDDVVQARWWMHHGWSVNRIDKFLRWIMPIVVFCFSFSVSEAVKRLFWGNSIMTSQQWLNTCACIQGIWLLYPLENQ